MPVNVPSYAQQWINAASVGSGLPYEVVACQVNAESGFNAAAVSPAGAEGPYQFLPSTFYAYWHGSPFSWQDSTVAYSLYMSALLRQFYGNVRNALAAYNAGPNNLAAGYKYADGILECAGVENFTSGGGTTAQAMVATASDPNVQADDWSWYVSRAAQWLTELSGSAQYWADYIGKL